MLPRSSILFLASLLCMEAQGFAPQQQPYKSTTTTALDLLPTQGTQLEAAFEAACAQGYDEDGTIDSDTCLIDPPPAMPALQRARAFVTRVASLPSTLLHPKSEESTYSSILSTSNFDHLNKHKNNNNDHDNDVVLYPIVGFCLMNDREKHVVRALPTVSDASCRLNTQQREEVLYGWFSPVCRLEP